MLPCRSFLEEMVFKLSALKIEYIAEMKESNYI